MGYFGPIFDVYLRVFGVKMGSKMGSQDGSRRPFIRGFGLRAMAQTMDLDSHLILSYVI